MPSTAKVLIEIYQVKTTKSMIKVSVSGGEESNVVVKKTPSWSGNCNRFTRLRHLFLAGTFHDNASFRIKVPIFSGVSQCCGKLHLKKWYDAFLLETTMSNALDSTRLTFSRLYHRDTISSQGRQCHLVLQCCTFQASNSLLTTALVSNHPWSYHRPISSTRSISRASTTPSNDCPRYGIAIIYSI